jgi:hypothetical protein
MSIIAYSMIFFNTTSLCAQNRGYPQFDQGFWEKEQGKGKGKIIRGAGLTVLGLGAIVPAAVFVDRAFSNPHMYAALGAVASIAAVSMTLHGINSITSGKKEKDKANFFVDKYKSDPNHSDKTEEAEFYKNYKKQSALKLVLFGSVLSAQGLILLVNGVVLNIQNGMNRDTGGAHLWPSYVFGGLCLGAGIFLIVKNVRKYRDISSWQLADLAVTGRVSIAPWFYRNPQTNEFNFGLGGKYSF